MIEVQHIESNDLPELALLLEELSGKATCQEAMVRNFEWMAKNPDYIVLGAKVEGRLVGSLMGIVCHDLAGDCRPFLVIENVIVAQKSRGLGVGKQLMRAIEGIGRERNCYYTMFVSGAQRLEAHRFYYELGYRPDEVKGFKKYLL